MELLFSGVVKGGKFIPDDPVSFAGRMTRLEGKRTSASFKRKYQHATTNQHAYYRSTVLPIIAEWCGYDARDGSDLEKIHIGLKRKVFGVRIVNGLEVVVSHADVDVEEFSDFLDKVLRWAAEGGCYVPGPEEIRA